MLLLRSLIFSIILMAIIGKFGDAQDIPNIMLRVVYVPTEWMEFGDIGGWDAAVPEKESENLKYYEATIWEDISAVHLYEFSNEYDPRSRFWEPDDENIAYREKFARKKYTGLPADVPGINKDDRSLYLRDVFVKIATYIVNRHPNAEHHLTYNGHGAPGGDLFELMLNREHAYGFLKHWTRKLGKPLGVIDMGGPCNKAGFGDLVNFCEFTKYYIAADMPNGGYDMDDWTFEKYVETDYDIQYHNVFAAHQTLEETLKNRIDLNRKSYEYSKNYMIENQVQQASYLFSCEAFLEFYPEFLVFLEKTRTFGNYSSHGDVYEYMKDKNAPQPLIDKYNAIIIYNVDNRDFFQWTQEHNGMSLPHVDYLQRLHKMAKNIAAAPAVIRNVSPDVTTLLPNYPNPFNPETWIPYSLSKPANVTLKIYSIDGYLVRQLVLGYKPNGFYHTQGRAAYWDGRNEMGEPVSSGIYFYILNAGDFKASRKMLVIK